jgi:hypothetical protein
MADCQFQRIQFQRVGWESDSWCIASSYEGARRVPQDLFQPGLCGDADKQVAMILRSIVEGFAD